MRIGFGYDSHRFGDGDGLPIGGVKVPHTHGVIAHSDGDVLLHAISDALLGAAALGDIGHHFPDTDASFLHIDSKELLAQIVILLNQSHWKIENIDATVIAEAPRLAPYIESMRANIGDCLDIPMTRVSVKATTNEKMGWIGKGEGLAAHAVVLLSAVA